MTTLVWAFALDAFVWPWWSLSQLVKVVAMSQAQYVLCQDCLNVYPFTDARHNEEEFCFCGGQLCGCSSCDSDAAKIVQAGVVGDESKSQDAIKAEA